MQNIKTSILFLILVIDSFILFIEQILVVQTLFGRQFTLVLRIVEKEKRSWRCWEGKGREDDFVRSSAELEGTELRGIRVADEDSKPK